MKRGEERRRKKEVWQALKGGWGGSDREGEGTINKGKDIMRTSG